MEKQQLPFDQKIVILTKVLEALQHAHGLDVVHRDIKPSNIHVSSDGTIKLMDFGLARVLVADTLTASGNVLGTPHYASPEQLKGEVIDRRTDIYSTGVMAYEMLSGRRPFEPDNDSATSLILKVIQTPAQPMNTEMSRLLPDIESIVQRAMAKTPAERFQSADEMRAALLRFLDQSRQTISKVDSKASDPTVIVDPADLEKTIKIKTIPMGPLSSGEHTQSKKWLWGGGAVAAVAVGAMLMALPSKKVDPPPDNSSATAPAPAPTGNVVEPPSPSPLVERVKNPVPETSGTPAKSENPAPPDGTAKNAAASAANLAAKTTAAPAPVPAPAPPPAKELTAKEMFNDNDANVAPGLRFRMVQAGAGDAPMDVDPAKEFQTGDRIRFAFEANIDGYLYVAQQGTSGNWTVLFPNPDINGGRNAVKARQEYEVPQGDWFRLDPPVGSEKIFVFLSREPMASLPGFQQPVREYGRGSAPMIASLQGSIASRDLVFTKDTNAAAKSQATYIVNKSEVGKAVTASFTITHK
jgi:hypothetical protein